MVVFVAMATIVLVGLRPPSPLCLVIGQILEYFGSLNIHIMELFGQSECTGPQTHNTPEAWKMGSCGRPMVVSWHTSDRSYQIPIS